MTYVVEAHRDYPDDGILAGDSLIVEQQDSAEDGDLVVALADGVATVRRYVPGVRVLARVVEVARRIA